jgi:hypothetical protein
MPALRLIELRLAPGINGAEVTGDLSERLGAAGISGEILRPHPNQTQQALKAAPLLVHGGAIGFALVLCAIAGLAARGLASRRADLIQVLADLGATRGQAGKRIGDEAGAIGFGAGLLAAFLAAAGAFAAMLLMIPGADLSNLARHISLLDVAPLALAPFLCAFVAGSGARAAADSLYAEAARLA